MAKLSGRSPFLVTVETRRGGILRAVRASGEIIARRPSGAGHHIAGRIKPGIPPARVAELWTIKYPSAVVSLTTAGREYGDRPIVTEAAARKRAAAKAAAAARASAERAATEAEESSVLASGEDAILSYVATCVRSRTSPIDPFLRAVYESARFHTDAGGYLGTLIGASALAGDRFKEAESLGERVAQSLTGARITPGLSAWARVL